MKPHKTAGYTKDGIVWIPEIAITPRPGLRYEALRGYGFTLAAFEGAECIGFISCEELGFRTAGEWLDAQPKVTE